MGTFIGTSKPTRELLKEIKRAADSEDDILLLGETGAGKGLTAEKIYSLASDKYNTFKKISCANLHEHLLESELFGYKKGAFTGAVQDTEGIIKNAEGGILFLDEIGDISPGIQAKLLQVTEDRTIRRLGGSKNVRVNVRFIFATNKRLDKSVEQGKFRQDLFYRINTYVIEIPPLRERKEDIPDLAEYFIKLHSKEKRKILTRDALEKLQNYHFPGNIRELESIIKKASRLSHNNRIDSSHILFTNDLTGQTKRIKKKRKKFSKKQIIEALLKHHGNKTKAAGELGISRVHFYRIYKQLIKE
ncbi:MAG: AAA domain-containing protein [Candidatus Lokiarchaeota archaeon]|nr:AAA domain-containing protein [Candidatus Lokiarchaeota archaeon]